MTAPSPSLSGIADVLEGRAQVVLRPRALPQCGHVFNVRPELAAQPEHQLCLQCYGPLFRRAWVDGRV